MLFTWVINLTPKKWQVESESLCILHLHPQLVDRKYKKKLVDRIYSMYTPIFLSLYTYYLSFFFLILVFDTEYAYLSVHRSLGNHGPNKLCLEILPHGRSLSRHSVLHFLLLCTSIQPHVT